MCIRDSVLTENITAKKYTQGYKVIWSRPIVITGGYTQMWAAQCGLQGGVPGDVNGWADRVRFSSGSDYLAVDGDATAVGRELSNQVLFYGSQYDSLDKPLRDSDSGNKAMLVTFPDLELSMQSFKSATAGELGVWIEQRATINKLYMESLDNYGNVNSGDYLQGMMNVRFLYSDAVHSILGF